MSVMSCLLGSSPLRPGEVGEKFHLVVYFWKHYCCVERLLLGNPGALDLDFLNSAELVEEEQRAEAYIYSATDEQAKRISDFRGDEGKEPEWAGFAKTLDKKKIDFLEALSTYVYLHAAGHRNKKLKEIFERIKSHLTLLFNEVAEFAMEHSLLKPCTR